MNLPNKLTLARIMMVPLVVIVYLAICFLTLEPFLTGILSYYVFYLYALLLAQNERNKSLIKALNTNEKKD